MDRVLAGTADKKDIDTIYDVAANIQGTTLCALGDFAANPILATIEHFPDEFAAYTEKTAIEAADGDPSVMEEPSAGKRRAEAEAAGD
jgi:NADH-quinone oxidoreductase subunit F